MQLGHNPYLRYQEECSGCWLGQVVNITGTHIVSSIGSMAEICGSSAGFQISGPAFLKARLKSPLQKEGAFLPH